MNLHLVTFISALAIVSRAGQSGHIRAILILFRHGDRTPTSPYPGDPFDEYFKQRGRGNLTFRGCERLHQNGQQLAKIFPQIRDAKTVQLMSSVTPRCIKSAKCFNSGLTKRTEEPIVRPGPLLDHPSINCPRRNFSIHKDPLFRTVYQKYSKLIANLSRVTNYSFSVTDANAIGYKILDPILSEYLMDLPMPAWFTPEFRDAALSYTDDNFDALGHLKIENKLSGLFLQEAIDKMTNSDPGQVSVYAYSSHDSTLGPVMVTVNAWMGQHPKYGESLILTLDRDGQVKVFYQDEGHKLTKHVPFGCSINKCTLEMFTSGVARFIPQNLDNECQLKSA